MKKYFRETFFLVVLLLLFIDILIKAFDFNNRIGLSLYYNDISSLDMAICGLNIKEINKNNRPVNGGLEILNLYKN